MADTINATDLPLETANTLDGTEKIVGFDTTQGKAITVDQLAEYILQKKLSTLAGASQTVAAALTALNSNAFPARMMLVRETTGFTLSLPSDGRFVIFALCNGSSSMFSCIATVYASGKVFITELGIGSDVTVDTSVNNKLIVTPGPRVTYNILIMSPKDDGSINNVVLS